MSATRVPLPGVPLRAGETVPLPERAAHHLTVVRRLEAGAALVVFDGEGAEADARLIRNEDAWGARVVAVRAGRTGAPVTLCYALPKGDRLETVARQCTELGADAICLLSAARSVVKLSGDRARRRLKRLERVVADAARQCGRADVPALTGPMSVAEAAERLADRTRLVLHPEGGRPLREAPLAPPLALFVGPEGGFTDDELTALDAAGCHRVTLSSPVLRTETAAVVATALALHHVDAL